MQFDAETQKNLDAWLKGNYDEKTKAEIEKLLKVNPQKIVDGFYTRMAFGTGGLRGIMGVGTNCMNQYTIGAATQGLANYINMQKSKDPHSVLIGYDCRHNSEFFSEVAARVLAANNIKVYMYSKLHPVPLVSFGCRYKKCIAAIMITASHNPPEYNGYKVYWADGAQVLPPHDDGIIKEVYKITEVDQVKSLHNLNSPLIQIIEDEIDKVYLHEIHKLQHFPVDNKQRGKDLKIIYTPIHGAGITMVPKALESWGFTSYHLVNKQAAPNGDFPTVQRANPEEKAALQLGIDQLLEEKADILLGTDPDSDRIGAVVLHECKAALLSGNEIASLCTEYLCQTLKTRNQMPKNGAFIKTIVTSELIKAIAEANEVSCFNVLTGFKYIGQLIYEWEKSSPKYQYIFGGEESYGYLIGTHSRDKDAVVMAALICEMALQAKLEGKTLVDKLNEVYNKYGIYREKLTSLDYPESKETKDNINKMMDHLRQNPPRSFSDIPVISLEDYQSSKKINLATGKEVPLILPKSNVLLFWLEDGSKIVIRPSGTEPKVKIYCGAYDKKEKDLKIGIPKVDKRLEVLTKDLERILK